MAAAKPGLPRRVSSKAKTEMAGQHEFPALFTIEGSSRHEIILVNPGHDLDELKATISKVASTSPNCAEFLQKYRSKETVEQVGQIKVKWGGRDKQLFPKETLVTEENSEAVLRMMAIGQGNDVFDVQLAKQAPPAAGGGAKK